MSESNFLGLKMSYLKDELKNRYEDRINFEANKFTALRKLQEEFDKNEFTAEEIQLIGELIIDIINKHNGSKEEIFKTLNKLSEA